MKVGDYVRISNGQIAKITKIKEYKKWSNIIYTDNIIDMHEDRCCNENFIDEEDIIKSSPNIIDLIEEHDILKIEERKGVYTICEVEVFKEPYEYYTFLGVRIDNKPIARKLYELNIKSIVTKEQFESMEYRIGE